MNICLSQNISLHFKVYIIGGLIANGPMDAIEVIDLDSKTIMAFNKSGK